MAENACFFFRQPNFLKEHWRKIVKKRMAENARFLKKHSRKSIFFEKKMAENARFLKKHSRKSIFYEKKMAENKDFVYHYHAARTWPDFRSRPIQNGVNWFLAQWLSLCSQRDCIFNKKHIFDSKWQRYFINFTKLMQYLPTNWHQNTKWFTNEYQRWITIHSNRSAQGIPCAERCQYRTIQLHSV